MTLCTLRATTLLSRDCRADFGRPLTKVVMSHLRDGPGVTAPSRTNIVPLTGVWNPPPSVTPPLKSPRQNRNEGTKKTERRYQKHRNESTFAKTTLLQSLPFVSPRFFGFSTLFLPFSPFSGAPGEHVESPEIAGKGALSSDVLGFA